MRRALALLVAASLLAPGAPRGEEAPVYTAPTDPPAKAADLTWRGPALTAQGVWLTKEQSIAVGKRVIACEAALDKSTDTEARCVVALAKAQGEVKTPRWVFVAVGIAVGIAGGAAAGYVAGRLAR